MLSRFPCSVCKTRNAGKLASAYWAWFRADGVRTAWKQRLCVECAQRELKQLLASATTSSLDVCRCPSCGADSSSDLDPIYLTIYVPKQEPSEWSLTTCASCAARVRITAQNGAEKLPDRQVSSSLPSATSPWDSLGINPQT